jgi:hypothetical protein
MTGLQEKFPKLQLCPVVAKWKLFFPNNHTILQPSLQQLMIAVIFFADIPNSPSQPAAKTDMAKQNFHEKYFVLDQEILLLVLDF